MTKRKRVNTSAVSQVNQTSNKKAVCAEDTNTESHKNNHLVSKKNKSTNSDALNASTNTVANSNAQKSAQQSAQKSAQQNANQQAKIVDSSSQKNNTTKSSKRNPAIDGLRALAIIGIVCFHMRPSLLSGGFLGVTLFLVLSGYFCTRTVLKYLNDLSKLTSHYLHYLWRRLKRIWPPTLGIIAVTAPIMWLFSPSLLPKLQADAFAGAGFFSNIMYVARKLSYFEQSGLPSPIKHLWYLGLVMQAFIVWPLILAALIKFVKKPMMRMYITAGLAALSAVLTSTFAYLFGNYSTPARVYYSLDTRASEFLLGAMLAMYGAWFAKHSLHEWLIRLWYWIRGSKNVKVTLASNSAIKSNKNYSNSSSANAEVNSQSSSQASVDLEQSAIANNIPEDLRAGLQIDLSENNATPDIHEFPEDVFNTPKTIFYNPLRAHQRSCIGLLAAIILCYCFVYADGTSSVFSFGGYTLTAAVCTLIVWSCTQSDNICSRIFAIKPLAYIGKRSFAIYLVHFPVLELCNPATRTTALSWWEQLFQIALILVLSECFYQVFEKPVNNQNLLKLIRCCAVTLCLIITIILIALPINWHKISNERSIQLRPELVASVNVNKNKNFAAKKTTTHKNAAEAKISHVTLTKNTLPPTPSKHRILFPIAEKVPQNLITSHTQIDKTKNTCSVNFTMVGDSITEGAKPYLMKVMPNAYIDGKVSRQIFHGAEEYAQDISSKHAGDIVVYALGTNGPPHDDSVLQNMVDVAKGKPVYFVTTRVPQPWQDVTNSRLRSFAATHANVGIIDWNGFSQGHSEYLTDDGVHLTPVGGPEYAKMIRLALCGG